MRIVVTNRVLLQISQYVAYMKRYSGFDANGLINNKNQMLLFVSKYINNAAVKNNNSMPKRYGCYWKDGKTPMAWVFSFMVLPQQDLVVIDSWTNRNTTPMQESELRGIVKKVIKENLDKYVDKKIGEFDVLNGDNAFGWDPIQADGIEDKGFISPIRMYSSDDLTIAMFKRRDNGKYFYAKIVPAPELGEKATKWQAVRLKEVPQKIIQDQHTLRHRSY